MRCCCWLRGLRFSGEIVKVGNLWSAVLDPNFSRQVAREPLIVCSEQFKSVDHVHKLFLFLPAWVARSKLTTGCYVRVPHGCHQENWQEIHQWVCESLQSPQARWEPTHTFTTCCVCSVRLHYVILFIFTLNFSLFSWQFVFSQCTISCLHCLMCVVSSYAARTRRFTSSKCQLHPEGSEYCEHIFSSYPVCSFKHNQRTFLCWVRFKKEGFHWNKQLLLKTTALPSDEVSVWSWDKTEHILYTYAYTLKLLC